MNKLILFYGTPDKIVVPTYGKGEEKHDYGQGFYLTDSIDLAKEFVRDNIDIDILEELLLLGGLGIQYCIKSELAYAKLHEIKSELAYSKYYLNDVVENQGKLFDFVAQNFPNMDTEDFINVYI